MLINSEEDLKSSYTLISSKDLNVIKNKDNLLIIADISSVKYSEVMQFNNWIEIFDINLLGLFLIN